MNIVAVVTLFLAIVVALVQCLSFMVTAKIYIEVKQHKKPLGRIVIGLFGKIAPRAVANFHQLCVEGINGTTYVGARIHRVVDHFIIQGGDIVNGDGTGSISIYGEYFDDDKEAINVEHNRPGYVGMANRGPNTNGCQFYVTTVAAKWLNGKHTVFGKVLDGMDTVYAIQGVKTDTDDIPVSPITIIGCGEIPTEPFEYYPDDYNLLAWIKVAGIPVLSSLVILIIFHYFFRQLNMYC